MKLSVTVDFGWFDLFKSINISIFKIDSIVIFGLITPFLLASTCFALFWIHISMLLQYYALLNITDDGSVPEMLR